ncbi:hypothetical protein K469DRAFT_471958, partial [Zopfia rhizophila CBS 207.26]
KLRPSADTVPKTLLPIYNQLMTLQKCLLEVKKSRDILSVRELYSYIMNLNSVDNMRVDGKFAVGSDIPDGQGGVTKLLEECFVIAYDIRLEAEANNSAE